MVQQTLWIWIKPFPKQAVMPLQPSCSQSNSPLHSPSCSGSPCCSDHSHHQQTLFQYSQDSINVILANSIETTTQPKGFLFTENTSDGQVSFYTRLQLPTRDGSKLMTMKIEPGAQVNTIPLSKYQSSFPIKLMTLGTPNMGPSTLLFTP